MVWYWIVLVILAGIVVGGLVMTYVTVNVCMEAIFLFKRTPLKSAAPKGDIGIDIFPKWALITVAIIGAPIYAVGWVVKLFTGEIGSAPKAAGLKGHGGVGPGWVLLYILAAPYILIREFFAGKFRSGKKGHSPPSPWLIPFLIPLLWANDVGWWLHDLFTSDEKGNPHDISGEPDCAKCDPTIDCDTHRDKLAGG